MYEALRKKRKDTNTTIKTLRELIDIQTDAGYLKKETGVTVFTVEEAKLLAGYFGMTVDALFGNRLSGED